MGNQSCAVSGWSVRFHVPGINPQARRKMEGTSFTNILRIPPKRVKPISPYETGRPRPTPEHYRHSGFPFRHPRLLPSVIPAFSPSVILAFPASVIPAFSPLCHPCLLPPLSSLPSPPSVILCLLPPLSSSAFSPLCHPCLLPPLSSLPSPPSVILAFSPLCHPRLLPPLSSSPSPPSVIPAFSPSVIPAFSPSVIPAFSPLRHPRLLPPLSSSPSPPSVILDISNRGSRVFCMYTRAIPWRHLRAPLVLGPFAETKGPRRAGPKPRKNLSPFCHPGLDPGSRALLVFSVVGAASNAARPPCSPGPCGLPTLSLWEMAGVRRAGEEVEATERCGALRRLRLSASP